MIALLPFALAAAEPPKTPPKKSEEAKAVLCVAPIAGPAGKRKAACLNGLELVRPKRPNDAQRVVPGLY